MADEDKVRVQALTTYMEGHEHKNQRSKPYEVTRAHAVDLTANGFARIVSERPAEKQDPVEVAEDARVEPAIESAIDNDGKPRGRRGPGRA